MRGNLNKQPRVIFEKPEKFNKSKTLTNDYVFSIGTLQDQMKKYNPNHSIINS